MEERDGESRLIGLMNVHKINLQINLAEESNVFVTNGW